MKKISLEIILFVVNAIYMILELIASRILSPYFGNSNMVWTSVIGIILLSTSIGNYLGGLLADKNSSNNKVKIILGVSGILIMLIPILQKLILEFIISVILSIKLGAILATILLFLIPSMLIGMLSPIIIKLKMKEIKHVGKISGKISAIATLGSITGTFLGGFWLIPAFGCNEILFVLAIIMFGLIAFTLFFEEKEERKSNTIITLVAISICIIICSVCFYLFTKTNKINGEKVLNGEKNVSVSYDTEYGRVLIYNKGKTRYLNINKGNESATFTNEDRCYDLVFEYTKYYDLMFKSSNEIKDVLMIGGGGYSYPKYFISNYPEKNMDVVEIDEKLIEISKKYFFLDKLIDDYNLEENHRLSFITDDGRAYINQNTKKYDAILNDAFSGESPVTTLTTVEAVQKIYDSLNENGIYLSNIISAVKGENANFLKAEVNTLKQVFKNVYVVQCNLKNGLEYIQNNMVIATDEVLQIADAVEVNTKNMMVLSDNYCPVESLIP